MMPTERAGEKIARINHWIAIKLEEKTMKEPMKIYDGRSGLQKRWTESKNGTGFHPLFTADARRSIVLDALKIWLLLGFVVGAVTGFVLSGVPGALFMGVLIAGIIYFGYRGDPFRVEKVPSFV